jgi:hypothetical protein
MRFHLFEFEDQPWFPDAIRAGGTDYLRFVFSKLDLYASAAPVISELLNRSGDCNVLDLCSGGGGPIAKIQEKLPAKICFTLSDKFPNVPAYKFLRRKSGGKINFIEIPVDADNVPASHPGVRVLFSSAHHFHPEKLKAILKNAVDNDRPIAVFDGGNKNVFMLGGILLFHPLAFVLLTPFLRPLRLSRILFTYFLPLIPLYTIWDGCISVLRLYSAADLLKLAMDVDNTKYEWHSGKLKSRFGLEICYLAGCLKKGKN